MIYRKASLMFGITLLLLVVLITSAEDASAIGHQRVLVISSYHPAFPTFFQQIDGIRSVLDDADVQLDIEFMDSKRFNDPVNIGHFYASLSYKLSQMSPYDAVIATDDNALAFVLAYQQELFATTPVVFLGVNNIELALSQNDNPTVTGVVEAVSMADTVELMTELTPGVSRIYAIVDATPSGQGDLATFRKVSEGYDDVDFLELSLTELTFAELSDQLAALDASSAVLLLSAYNDRSGAALDFEESLRLIRGSLQRPLYHLWYHGIGDGVLGGKLISQFEQGKTAAEMTLRILNGEAVQGISVLEESPNRYVFDYAEMETYGVKVSDLPPDSIVLDLPQTFYSKYKTIVWPAAAVFLTLTTLVVFLSVNLIHLRQAQQELLLSDVILRQIPEAVILTDLAGNIERWMGKAVEIFGYSAEDAVGRPVNFVHLPEIRATKTAEIIKDVSETGRYFGEMLCVRQDGTSVPVEMTVVTLLDKFGNPLGLVGVNRDITERKQAEAALREYQLNLENLVSERTSELEVRMDEVAHLNTALVDSLEDLKTTNRNLELARTKLESVNQELEDFAYVVSHDLKAPLRGIGQLATWIVEDYRELLDDDGRHKLELLTDRVTRMHDLIDGVLQYSRAGRNVGGVRAVDLAQLVPDVISLLTPPDHVEVTVVDPLPVVMGDPTRLLQLFQNLLDNGIKFLDKPEGVIQIGCKGRDTVWEFSVSDNGRGIEQRNFDRIFRLFQTLNPEPAGTGIGLALVKRIVEGSSGRVWLQSTVGSGTTFYFTLPKREVAV